MFTVFDADSIKNSLSFEEGVSNRWERSHFLLERLRASILFILWPHIIRRSVLVKAIAEQ